MYVEGRKPEIIPIALPFGSAIHMALQKFYLSVKNNAILHLWRPSLAGLKIA